MSKTLSTKQGAADGLGAMLICVLLCEGVSSHEGRVYPERTRHHSLGSVLTGASGVAGLNLLPQSLLPEFMPDISQMLSGRHSGQGKVGEP